jgi:hypothetical protein
MAEIALAQIRVVGDRLEITIAMPEFDFAVFGTCGDEQIVGRQSLSLSSQ